MKSVCVLGVVSFRLHPHQLKLCSHHQVSPFFGTIYNMLYYTAMAAEQQREATGRWVSGSVLPDGEGGFEFDGFNQPVYGGTGGEGMQVKFVVLDTDGKSGRLQSTHILDAPHTAGKFGGLKYLGRSIHFAGSTPSHDSNCWFSPYITCTGGERHVEGCVCVRIACV